MSNYFLQILNRDALIYECLFKTLITLEMCNISKTKMYLNDRIGSRVFSNQLAAILIFL